MTSLCHRLVPAVFMLTLAVAAHAQSGGSAPPPARQGQPGRSVQPGQPSQTWTGPRGPEPWWRDRSPIAKELGLTKDQSDRIEKIFQDTKPDLNKLDDSLQRREDMLSDLIKDDSAEAMISQQIDNVERTRSALNKARQLMLVHMRQALTAPQRAKFETLHAQFQEELRQAEAERQKQERDRKQTQNQKPDQRSAPDRQGRPKF